MTTTNLNWSDVREAYDLKRGILIRHHLRSNIVQIQRLPVVDSKASAIKTDIDKTINKLLKELNND